MTRTRQQLLENFDDEVREKLRVRDEASKEYLNRYERLLMQLTRHGLNGQAEFLSDASFRLNAPPFPESSADIPLGTYELPRRSGDAHLYRLNHPLAEALLARAKVRELAPAEIHFDYGQHVGKVSLLEPLIGKSGWLKISLFSVESLDQAEDHLIHAATTDDGESLDDEAATRLVTLPGRLNGKIQPAPPPELDLQTQHRQAVIQREISDRNARFFDAEAEKLDGWADDLKVGLEREIGDLDRQIKDARRAATTALSLDEKLTAQKQIKSIEAQRNQKRRSLFEAQDQVDKQREELIAVIEGKLKQRTSLDSVFVLRWMLS